jgi:hypothetical protein
MIGEGRPFMAGGVELARSVMVFLRRLPRLEGDHAATAALILPQVLSPKASSCVLSLQRRFSLPIPSFATRLHFGNIVAAAWSTLERTSDGRTVPGGHYRFPALDG